MSELTEGWSERACASLSSPDMPMGFSFSLELLTQGRPSVQYLDTRPLLPIWMNIENGSPLAAPILRFRCPSLEIAESPATGILGAFLVPWVWRADPFLPPGRR
jgi:hypothetical protein